MKHKKIIPIELSEEDKKLLEQQKEDIEWLKKQLFKSLRIPKEYFNDNPDEK